MKKIAQSFLAIAVLTGGTGAALAHEELDDTPRVAVMSAFPPEWIALQKVLSDREDHTVNGVKFVTGKIEGQDVVLFLSGVSMVNAAMTTQLALDHFDVQSILFSGIAGGVDPELNIGDVVIAGQWGQYLELIMARDVDGEYKIPPFLNAAFPGYGMMVPENVSVVVEGENEPVSKFWFDVDPKLLKAAEEVASKIELEDCNADNACLSEAPQIIVGGHGVSGSAFVDNADFRKYVFETYEAKVVDMESAAVAHVAFANSVPFIAFRSLSDLAGGGEGENEMGTFMSLASTNSASVVEAFLAAMDEPSEESSPVKEGEAAE